MGKAPQSYVALDLEMTGLNPKEDSIIEIGAVRVLDGNVTEKYDTFVIPSKTLPDRVQELTGISKEDLEGGIPLEQAVAEVLDFIGELPLLGHSILFDYSFLKRAAVNQKRSFEKAGIDTLRIARAVLPELPSKKLQALCAHFSIEYRAHRAFEDAMATVRLYQKLAEQFYNETNEPLFQPVALQYKVKREGPASGRQKERLYELTAKHGIIPDFDIEKLTRNQASRYTDKILEKYGRN